MKRDLNLLERMLLTAGESGGKLNKLDGVEQDLFSFHAKLLEDISLVEVSKNDFPNTTIVRLTFKGHDVLEDIQSKDFINWSNLVGCSCC
ncbi:DUF2513 domain-containing protein [Pseudomonas putida]|uniref:DUF2513 domain-containing protein n=1 Tax=Pseudomonas putida TaxID=303 RepID=A0A8I1JKQ2_PSEPU|nr:DUF2513 domain-containing protein [Pseudomonas putida]MBI6885861.1 DUF2513 domain-containing protein [Pseudomonas putida]